MAICFSASTTRTTVVDFPENSNDSFLKQFSYKSRQSRPSFGTVVSPTDRDSTSNGGVNLSVTAIDTDVLIPSSRSRRVLQADARPVRMAVSSGSFENPNQLHRGRQLLQIFLQKAFVS